MRKTARRTARTGRQASPAAKKPKAGPPLWNRRPKGLGGGNSPGLRSKAVGMPVLFTRGQGTYQGGTRMHKVFPEKFRLTLGRRAAARPPGTCAQLTSTNRLRRRGWRFPRPCAWAGFPGVPEKTRAPRCFGAFAGARSRCSPLVEGLGPRPLKSLAGFVGGGWGERHGRSWSTPPPTSLAWEDRPGFLDGGGGDVRRAAKPSPGCFVAAPRRGSPRDLYRGAGSVGASRLDGPIIEVRRSVKQNPTDTGAAVDDVGARKAKARRQPSRPSALRQDSGHQRAGSSGIRQLRPGPSRYSDRSGLATIRGKRNGTAAGNRSHRLSWLGKQRPRPITGAPSLRGRKAGRWIWRVRAAGSASNVAERAKLSATAVVRLVRAGPCRRVYGGQALRHWLVDTVRAGGRPESRWAWWRNKVFGRPKDDVKGAQLTDLRSPRGRPRAQGRTPPNKDHRLRACSTAGGLRPTLPNKLGAGPKTCRDLERFEKPARGRVGIKRWTLRLFEADGRLLPSRQRKAAAYLPAPSISSGFRKRPVLRRCC